MLKDNINVKYTEQLTDEEFEKAPCAATFGKTKYYLSVAYRANDGKLYPVIGQVRNAENGKIDVPFFYDPSKKTTIPRTALRNAIVKEFETKDGRSCCFVVAEVIRPTITRKLFELIVKDDIMSSVFKIR
jgi:hypothetical protein